MVRLVAPPATLRDVVEFFWLDEWSDDATTSHSFRIVADDAPHILWYLSGDRLLRTQRLSVAGARAWHHDASLAGRRVMAGARLVPGAIPTLFDDGYVSKLAQISVFPTTWFIDNTGKIQFKAIGNTGALVDEWSWRLEATKAGQVIQP